MHRSELDKAVAAARAAFPAWRAAPIEQRRAAVAKHGEVLGVNAQELARLFTLDHGRP